MAGNVVSNVKKYYGGQVPVPGQGDSDGKVKVLVEKTTTMEIEGVQTDVDLLYDADDLTTPVTPQQLGQWTDENYLIAFKKREDDGRVRGFILYALETTSTSTDTLVNRAEFIAFKEDMTGDPGASAYEFTMVEDSSTLTRYLQDENGEMVVKFNKSCVETGAQSDTLDNLVGTDSSLMEFEVFYHDGNAYLLLNTEALEEEIEGIEERLDTIEGILEELPSDEHGYFNSSIYTTPGDGTTTSLVMDNFRISEGRSVHGDNIEFVTTHQEGGVDFGEVYLNPGTYILNVHYTLQWVGNPRGTFLPLVTNVGEQPFDFSYEHEDILRSTRIVTRTTRGKFGLNFPFDADTPPMGIWVKYLEIAQIASYNHPAVTHDSTLAGSGQIGDPLGVTPAAFGKVKGIPTSISQFRLGDVIPVDGPNGPAKMPASDLQDAILGGPIDEAVQAWLDEHPEATTTVENDSITDVKLHPSIKFNSPSCNGSLARVLLDKDVQIGSQLVSSNTIYEVRWNFDLAGGSITIPSGSVLKFNGGIISNGTVDFNGCIIDAPLTKIFDNVLPTQNSKLGQPLNFKWFGAVGDGVVDDTVAIQYAISFGEKIYVRYGKGFRNHLREGVTFYGSSLDYYKITQQLMVPYECSFVGDFHVLYDGPKVANSGAILIYGTISGCTYRFSICPLDSVSDYSDGVEFYGVSFGDPDHVPIVEYCVVSINVSGFYGGLHFYGDSALGDKYVTSCDIRDIVITRCLYGITFSQFNGSWHNINKFNNIRYYPSSSGYIVPTGFRRAAAFRFVGDGIYWPNSLVFNNVEVEGHPLNNSNYVTSVIYVVKTATENNGSIYYWSLSNFRVENTRGEFIYSEATIDIATWSVDFRLYADSTRVKENDASYPLQGTNALPNAPGVSSAYEDSWDYREMCNAVVNGGVGYRFKSDIFFIAGINPPSTISSAPNTVEESRLNRFYGIPVYIYKIPSKTTVRLAISRANAVSVNIAIYDHELNLVTGNNIFDYVKNKGQNVYIDNNTLVPSDPVAVSQIVLASISENDVYLVVMTEGGHYTLFASSSSVTHYADSTGVIPFKGTAANIPTTGIGKGFKYSIVNSSSYYVRYLTQSGGPAWKLYNPVAYTYGVSAARPTGLNNNTDIGTQYFDTTLGMPIFWQGAKWVKSDGTDA